MSPMTSIDSFSNRLSCPSGHGGLEREFQPPFLLWRCRRCIGCAATMAVLRRGIRNDVIQLAWNRSIGSGEKRHRRCPGCVSYMYTVPTSGPEIDICRSCQMIWFDAGEFDTLPPRSEPELLLEQWEEKLREWQARNERKAAERRAAIRRYNSGVPGWPP